MRNEFEKKKIGFKWFFYIMFVFLILSQILFGYLLTDYVKQNGGVSNTIDVIVNNSKVLLKIDK